MDKTIQDLIFEIMERSSYNEFNGKAVVKDLQSHKDLWKGVVMDREYGSFDPVDRDGFKHGIDLIKLRDICDNIYNVDTLFILPSGKDDEALRKLALGWDADEVDWVGNGDHYSLGIGGKNSDIKILRIWWD